MPKAICRCGQPLNVPTNGTESGRVVCPGCGARVRVRKAQGAEAPGAATAADGFLRFFCPCGKRLKVPAVNPPAHGKCPDCGTVVPVPANARAGAGLPPGHPETPTAELDPNDLEALERWTRDHLTRAANAVGADIRDTTQIVNGPPTLPAGAGGPHRAEVGLRLCPNCGRPVHMGRDTCRECGTPVPRR
jgi:hypothetical protein